MLLKLEHVRADEGDFGSEKDNQVQRWREKSQQLLDEFQMKGLNSSEQANSIYMNSIQGRKLNCCITEDLNTHNIYLFLITNQTDKFGPILMNDLKCDFMLIKFECPIDQIKLDQDYHMNSLD